MTREPGIADWLGSIGLEEYVDVFATARVDLDVLADLTDDELKELGIPLGDRKRLLRAIGERDGADAPTDCMGDAADTPTKERRQVTILFADLTGYTTLTNQLGAERTHDLVQRFFEIVDGAVAAHRGMIERHIGDAIMAVFGVPTAHGNEAERAVHAAFAIHEAMPDLSAEFGVELTVHVGVASGQIIVSGSGDDAQDYATVGDSVNLAARLVGVAAPGQTVVSDAVRRQLRDRLSADDLGEISVKGFAEPLSVWRAVALRDHDAREGSPFAGRRSEMAKITAALTSCRDSGHGELIYLRGEAGIGKSRLTREAQAAAVALGFACHTGAILDFGQTAANSAVSQLVRGLLEVDSDTIDGIAAAIERHCGQDDSDQVYRSHLSRVVGVPLSDAMRSTFDAMDDQARRSGQAQALAALVKRSATARARMLIVEDLHWAETDTLDHISALCRGAAETPTLILITSRPEAERLNSQWRPESQGIPATVIDLGPLRPDELAPMVEAIGGADPAFLRSCIERAGGHPLFLEQLLQDRAQADHVQIPDSIQGLVQARVDRLDPAARLALDAAAVLGQRFDHDMVERMTGDTEFPGRDLAEHQFVRPDGDGYMFVHALVRDAVYGLLLSDAQSDWHKRAADLFADIDKVLCAEHLILAGHPAAGPACVAAARQHLAEYQYEQALAMARRGSALEQEPSDTHALLRITGECQRHLGDIEASLETCKQALRSARTDNDRTQIWLDIARGCRILDRLDEAFAALDQSENFAKKDSNPADLSVIYHTRGNLAFPLGDFEVCRAYHEQALEFSQQADSIELEAWAHDGLSDAYYAGGRWRTSRVHSEQCLAICRTHGYLHIEAANIANLATLLWYENELNAALVECRAGAVLADRITNRRALMLLANIAGSILIEQLRLDEARVELETGLAIANELGSPRFKAMLLANMASLNLARGQRGAALELLEDALRLCGVAALGFIGPRIMGEMALATDDRAQSENFLAKGEADLKRGCVAHNLPMFYGAAIDCMLERGERARAVAYADSLEAAFVVEPVGLTNYIVARGRALAAFGSGQRDDQLISELGRLKQEGEAGTLRRRTLAIDEALAQP